MTLTLLDRYLDAVGDNRVTLGAFAVHLLFQVVVVTSIFAIADEVTRRA